MRNYEKYYFGLPDVQFRQSLMALRDIVDETFYTGRGRAGLPGLEEHEKAWELMCAVHRYVAELPEKKRTFLEFLETVDCVCRGDFFFLKRLFPSDGVKCKKSDFKNNHNGIISLALQYLAVDIIFHTGEETVGSDSLYAMQVQSWIGNYLDRLEEKDDGKGTGLEIDTQFQVSLKQYLDQYIISQEGLKKKLSRAVYLHLKGIDSRPILMVGGTGTGKNYSIKILRQFFEENNISVPVMVYDGSQLTPDGYKGESVDTIISRYNRMRAQYQYPDDGIIFLDEVCKFCGAAHNASDVDFSRLVQGQLLSEISGRVVNSVDTSRILWILGGSFEGMDSGNAIGFVPSGGVGKNGVRSHIRQELLHYGMSKELLGRISSVVEMEEFSKDDYRSILLHPNGPLARKKKEYVVDGLEIEVDPDVIGLIVEEAAKQDLGARGVLNVVEALFSDYAFDMVEHGWTKIRIHKGMFASGHPEKPFFE